MQAQKNKEQKELKELRKLIPERRREDAARIVAQVLSDRKDKSRGGNKKKRNTNTNRGPGGAPYDVAKVLKQMILPIDCGGAESLVVSPNSQPAQVCARHIHKVVDVNSSQANLGNGFTVVMSPDLSLPGFISGTADALLPPFPGPISLTGSIRNEEGFTLVGGDVSPAFTTGQLVVGEGTEKTIINLVPISDGVTTYLGVPVTALPATRISMTVTCLGNSGRLKMFYKLAGGLWIMFSEPPHHIHFGQAVSVGFNNIANAVAYGFAITASAASDCEFKLQLGFDSQQFNVAGLNLLAPGFAPFLDGKGVRTGRVISMSVLATNTSADLANGGTISAARAPRNIKPFGSNVTSSIAELPENRRYQGPAKTGAYVTWLPSQSEEFEVNDIGPMAQIYSESEYLIVRVEGWPAGASFRLQFDWVVEFYTKSQLFEKVETPPMDDTFRQLLYLALSLDAATCNPGHIDLIRDYVRKGIGYGKKAVQFYGANKVLIDSILTALASMV